MTYFTRASVAALIALSILLITATSASAAVRYAAAAGSGVACSSGSPCFLDEAINNAAANDEVVVAAGTYDMTGISATNIGSLNVHGVAGQDRPVINCTTTCLDYRGGTLRHVVLSNNNSTAFANLSTAPDNATMLFDDVAFRNTGGGNSMSIALNGAGQTVTIRNSVLIPAFNATGLNIANAGAATNASVIVINSTIFLPGGGGSPRGLMCNSPAYTVAVSNSIIDATQTAGLHDIEFNGGCTNSVDHSWFKSGVGVTDGGGNISSGTSATILAAVDGSDVSQLAGSPTIDAGTQTGLLSSDVGFDGTLGDAKRPHYIGSAPDIGADEVTEAPTMTTDSLTPTSDTTVAFDGGIDTRGMEATWHIDFGTTTAYGQHTNSGTIVAGAHGTTDATATLTSLLPGTTYHVLVTVTTGGGTVTSGDMTVKTSGTAAGSTPLLTKLKVLPANFKPNKTCTGTLLASTKKGALITVAVSDATSVRFTFKRVGLHGKLVVLKPTVTLALKKGTSLRRLSGCLGGKKLAKGTYRLYAQRYAGGKLVGLPRFVTFIIH